MAKFYQKYSIIFKTNVCSPWTSASDQGKYGPSEELNLLMSTVFTLPIIAKYSFVLEQFPEILPIITVCVREVYLLKPKDKDYFS